MNDDLDILQQLESDPLPSRRGLSIGSVVLLIGVALTVLVFGIALVRQQQGQPTEGAAPDFTIQTFDGEQFTLSEHRGQVVVINFWASWCGPCRDEAPALESLWQQYKDQGVIFLGVTFSDIASDSLKFIDQFGMTYPNAPDERGDISKALYHIRSVPETFIIDQQGNIRRFFHSVLPDPTPAPGARVTPTPSPSDLIVTKSELASFIESILAES